MSLNCGPFSPIVDPAVPVWRNWQTRGTQNPVSSNRRVGSIPSTGTRFSPFPPYEEPSRVAFRKVVRYA